ncbi:MAG: glycoside hydrolase family 5 protein, partial [Bacteroidota bacterium]|nr:glycoside hydrolase family 5 protein [Bacteroidota bacterium]
MLSAFLLGGDLSKLQAQEAPFRKGINLTNWFQASSVREIQINKYTRTDFEQIKSLGCDVIRLPINLHYMTSGAPDYTLDPLFFQFLDQPVQWAEELNLNLILDNHTFDPVANTPPDIENILKKVWPQLAKHYQNRSNLLYYEILNEPHGISAAQWNAIQQNVINAIRAVDSKHTIIVGATNFNSYQSMAEMPVYSDPNLIYTFHFYDPFLFTHQGATWLEPSMVNLAQVPFPYRADGMPALPASLKNTWLESAYNNYPIEGTVAKVKELIDIAANFKNSHGVKVFCGEFGVLATNSPLADRVNWYKTVRTYLEEKNIPWTTWDYHGGFGLFEPGGADLFNHDLNLQLLTALGFILPPQTDYVLKPDTTGFLIYDDFLGSGITNE